MNEKTLRQLLIHSAIEVFDKMISVSLTEKCNATNGTLIFENKEHISASIGFAGGWNGSVTFQCLEEFGFMLTSKMLFTDPKQLNRAEVRDAMGEIVNMVGGKFKASFAESFSGGIEAFKMSVPTVTMGKDFHIYNLKNVSILEVLLDSGIEIVSLHLALKKANGDHS